jgi:hypothetical protein
MRLNAGKVRQSVWVTDAILNIRLMANQHTACAEFPFTGALVIDSTTGLAQRQRQALPQFLEDPYNGFIFTL